MVDIVTMEVMEVLEAILGLPAEQETILILFT
jgi:hypothetical protein